MPGLKIDLQYMACVEVRCQHARNKLDISLSVAVM
jgi:hypothetical protein